MPSVVFLDRDGVINENRGDYVKSWREFSFIPGAPRALARLTRAGVSIFVASNQSAIGRGLVSREEVEAINDRMVRELERHGARIGEVVFCPHVPTDGCDCRKPAPGMLLELARRHRLDLPSAVMIGDALSDIEAARAAGCSAVLVLTGRGREEWRRAKASGRDDFLVARDLEEAVDLLLPLQEPAMAFWYRKRLDPWR